MTTRNDITGDAIQTKQSSDAYRSGWDRIFGKKNANAQQESKDDEIDSKPAEDQDPQL